MFSEGQICGFNPEIGEVILGKMVVVKPVREACCEGRTT